MGSPRYLCSDLVSLTVNAVERMVNLEEIWPEGAILEAEYEVETGLHVEIRCDQALFQGKVTQVEPHEFGWRFEVEFSPETPWSVDRFRPQHMLDLSERAAE